MENELAFQTCQIATQWSGDVLESHICIAYVSFLGLYGEYYWQQDKYVISA